MSDILFGRIILERKSELMNRLKGYRVIINGAEQDKKISNGSSEEYAATGGSTEVVCKVNWCSSNSFLVDVKPGETVYLKVASGMKYFWIMYAFLMFTLLGRVIFKKQMTTELSIVMIGIALAVMCYFLFYITIGRKQYLKIVKDDNNIFAQ